MCFESRMNRYLMGRLVERGRLLGEGGVDSWVLKIKKLIRSTSLDHFPPPLPGNNRGLPWNSSKGHTLSVVRNSPSSLESPPEFLACSLELLPKGLQSDYRSCEGGLATPPQPGGLPHRVGLVRAAHRKVSGTLATVPGPTVSRDSVLPAFWIQAKPS